MALEKLGISPRTQISAGSVYGVKGTRFYPEQRVSLTEFSHDELKDWLRRKGCLKDE